MKHPKFDIQLSTDSVHSRVMCNDIDVSGAIRSVKIEQTAGQMPIVTLELGAISVVTRVQADVVLRALEDQGQESADETDRD